MFWLVLGLVLFLGVHAAQIVAADKVAAFKRERGEGLYKGLYSLVALAGLALIIWGYGQARIETNPVLWVAPLWLRPVVWLLMALALWFLLESVLAGPIGKRLRHPQLLAVAIWGAAHLAVNGDLASGLLFGGFLAWAIADLIALERRAAGRNRGGPVWRSIITAAAAAAIFGALSLGGHAWLFGVPIV